MLESRRWIRSVVLVPFVAIAGVACGKTDTGAPSADSTIPTELPHYYNPFDVSIRDDNEACLQAIDGIRVNTEETGAVSPRTGRTRRLATRRDCGSSPTVRMAGTSTATMR
jgi:hypothetical protein